MPKYEPIDISAELKAVSERLSQLMQLVKEDLVLISQPELNEYIKQIRLYLTEIRRIAMRHTPKDARKAMMERLEEYRKLDPNYEKTTIISDPDTEQD